MNQGKTVVVEIHGWTATPEKFALPWDCGNTVHEVRSLTLSGHAFDSTDEREKAKELANYNYHHWIADVGVTLLELIQREDVSRIFVIGHSMSGYLTLLALEELKTEGVDVRKVVGVGMVNAPYKLHLKFGLPLLLSKISFMHSVYHLEIKGKKLVQEYQGLGLVHKGGTEGANTLVAWSNMRDLATIIRKGKKVLPKVTVPLVLFQSGQDASVKEESAKHIERHVRVSCEIKSFPRGQHTPNPEEKKNIVSAIEKFLSSDSKVE
ncbi:alpha/beta hydrolase [Shimazuella kribbensis]|uniref:alpha/beta hydrolase n=1 Tax=Shimazuella kribbensis TaxID=139808 RepID=UPI0004175764|nr:alpha/beta hydrolase [Shimazuella kribbensis]